MIAQNFGLWFLRRFSKFRELEISEADWAKGLGDAVQEIDRLQKQAESDAALIESLNRYIEALEGRDKERVERISKLEDMCLGHLKTIKELREQLSGLVPPVKN